MFGRNVTCNPGMTRYLSHRVGGRYMVLFPGTASFTALSLCPPRSNGYCCSSESGSQQRLRLWSWRRVAFVYMYRYIDITTSGGASVLCGKLLSGVHYPADAASIFPLAKLPILPCMFEVQGEAYQTHTWSTGADCIYVLVC